MNDYLHVAFSCNSTESGRFLGTFASIEFSDEAHEHLLTLIGPDLPIALEKENSIEVRVVVDRTHRYDIRNFRAWVGNWCWNACLMKTDTAIALARVCKEAGFSLDEWVDGGPLAEVVEEFETREQREGN